ncbi:MAG: hypothetical protein Q8M29_07645 [Bacteroidota bacterium]|nr:hypothetical protein [Bacteroidota bacterium]
MFYANEDIVKELQTSTARMRLLKNGIVHYTHFPDAEVDVEQHLENHNALIELAGSVKRMILHDSSEMLHITSEARQKIRELESDCPVLARAIVTNSIGIKLFINFYIKMNKPLVKNKIFSNYEDAVNWLLQVREEED